MTESDLYKSLAKVTGEDIGRLRRMGFRVKVVKATNKRAEVNPVSELPQAFRGK